jgi:hypothetical protein
MPLKPYLLALAGLSVLLFTVHCGGEFSEADRLGVGAECSTVDDCSEAADGCLTIFKGGYCGVAGCVTNADCPEGSGCVTHDDDVNYCFLVCDAKAECNTNRASENEANCSGSITWADIDLGKACVPPSGS